MSGVCYPPKTSHMEQASIKGEPDLKCKQSKSENLEQLLEYKTLVSSAENKCIQLKGQLDHIKQLYSAKGERPKTSAPKNKLNFYTETVQDGDFRNARKIRQNSKVIDTDCTGGVLGTINNIMVGITKPMIISNSLQQLKLSRSKSPLTSVQKVSQNLLQGVEDVKINSKLKRIASLTKPKSKFVAAKNRAKCPAISSFTNFKRTKKPTMKTFGDKKRGKGLDLHKASVPLINRESSRIIKQVASKTQTSARSKVAKKDQDLVEIYHNTAAKESKSSDSDMAKKKLVTLQQNENIVPPLNFDDAIIENPRRYYTEEKTYHLPTISSTLKRAAKCYINSFNVKCIPFCLSTTTSPSHNIGFNIQQLMGMVKSKQPIAKLSPTLAYNIGVAAGLKNRDDPVSFLASSMTCKSFYPHCPLGRNIINYQHMQEVAKTIPEETIKEIDEEVDEGEPSPEAQSMIITGPSGEVKVHNKKQTVWSATNEEQKCTCVTPKGVGFQQIVNKFNDNINRTKQMSVIVPVKMKHPSAKIEPRSGAGESCKKAAIESTPPENKEKKLKEVLAKLHDEFKRMTEKYEELVEKTKKDPTDQQTENELEKLDKELNSKEEEIRMVMSLYSEVLTLKKQVKTLKVRTSRDNVVIRSHPSKIDSASAVTTATLLNKLLQQVQYFQTRYKPR